MKKTFVIAGLSALLSLSALADDAAGLKTDAAPPSANAIGDGYRGAESSRGMTVAQAKEMHNGATISLMGNLIKKTGDDRYQFRDKSGTIDVAIPMKVFDGKNVSPDELVSINGTLDKKQKPSVVKVDRFQKQ